MCTQSIGVVVASLLCVLLLAGILRSFSAYQTLSYAHDKVQDELRVTVTVCTYPEMLYMSFGYQPSLWESKVNPSSASMQPRITRTQVPVDMVTTCVND